MAEGRVTLLELRAIAAVHGGRVRLLHGPLLPDPSPPYTPARPFAYELLGDSARISLATDLQGCVDRHMVEVWAAHMRVAAAFRARQLGMKESGGAP